MEHIEYITVRTWFIEVLLPELDKIKNVLIAKADQNNSDLIFADWWAVFIKETFCLFEIIEKENQTRQFDMTIRSLMEFAADVSFIARYPSNLNEQKLKSEKFIGTKTEFAYAEIAKEAKTYHLREYRGNKAGKKTTTEDRIKLAFNKNAVFLYDYLNCFTHFNIYGIRIDLNIYNARDDSILRERITLLQFYPEILEIMTKSMGKLCKIKELEKYDFTAIQKIFTDIPRKWKLADRNYYKSNK